MTPRPISGDDPSAGPRLRQRHRRITGEHYAVFTHLPSGFRAAQHPAAWTLFTSAGMPTWTTPPLAAPSSPGCWEAKGLHRRGAGSAGLEASPVLFGTGECPNTPFWSAPATWIPWWPTIPWPNSAAAKDAYSPGEKIGLRPDRAVTVYAQILTQPLSGYPHSHRRLRSQSAPVCSLRLLERLRPSVGAGRIRGRPFDVRHGRTGNHPNRSGLPGRENLGGDAGYPRHLLSGCPGTDSLRLRGSVPAGSRSAKEKAAYAKATRIEMDHQDEITGRTLIQRQKHKMLVQNPPDGSADHRGNGLGVQPPLYAHLPSYL